jgi:hypothetical protein
MDIDADELGKTTLSLKAAVALWAIKNPPGARRGGFFC